MSLIDRARAELEAANPDLNIHVVDESDPLVGYRGWALRIPQELDDTSVDRLVEQFSALRPDSFTFMNIDISEGATSLTVAA